jgi:hypothetical protein
MHETVRPDPAARAADELRALGAKRALVLSTPEQAPHAEARRRS